MNALPDLKPAKVSTTQGSVSNLFYGTRGPHDAEIMVIGEAYGENERRYHQALVGASGHEFNKMLTEAKLDPSKILYTNVINEQPDGNNFTKFLISNELAKKSKIGGYRGCFPNAQLHIGIQRLYALIAHVKPKMIIVLGNWPLWALTTHGTVKTAKGFKQPTGIGSWRGSMVYTDPELPFEPIPLLPTYHPAAVLRTWKWRHTVVHDLSRAGQYFAGTLPWDDPREFKWLIRPGPKAVREWVDRFLSFPGDMLELDLDLETYAGKIHIFGVRDKESCLCIPFFDIKNKGTINTYSQMELRAIYTQLRRLLTDPRVYLVGQSIIYDCQYLRHWFCYEPKVSFDTMVAQHICWSTEQKGLDYLASIYCRFYQYWKEERKESINNEDLQQACEYNCLDLEYTYEVWKNLKHLLARLNLEQQFSDRMELFHILLKMMNRGVLIDTSLKDAYHFELMQKAYQLIQWLEGAIPDELKPVGKKGSAPWYRSNQKLQELLYNRLKLKRHYDRKSGNLTTGKETIEKLTELYPSMKPFLNALLLLRSMGVFSSTFLGATLDPDKRARCAYGPAATSTYRLNSTQNVFDRGLNLTNIPRDREAITLFNAGEILG